MADNRNELTSLQKAWGNEEKQKKWIELTEQTVNLALEKEFSSLDELYRFFCKERMEIAEKLGQKKIWTPDGKSVLSQFGLIRSDYESLEKQNVVTDIDKDNSPENRYRDFFNYLYNKMMTEAKTTNQMDYLNSIEYRFKGAAISLFYSKNRNSISIKSPNSTFYKNKLTSLETLFSNLKAESNKEKSINLTAEIVWELDQIMPALRGNAAIVEMLLKYLDKKYLEGSLGDYSHPNRIPLDLEATFSDKETFIKKFPSLFNNEPKPSVTTNYSS